MRVAYDMDFHEFYNRFADFGREEQFSDEALTALYEMFDHDGLEWDGDVISLCCTYSEIDADEVDEYPNVIEYLSNGKVLVAD